MMYWGFFYKTDSEKIKIPDVHDRTDSVYPISILTAPYGTFKTRPFTFSSFIGYVPWHSSLNPFLELHENFENPFQKNITKLLTALIAEEILKFLFC